MDFVITDPNGRCLMIEFSNFVILNTYVVNAGEGTLKNLQYKIEDFNPKLEQLLDHLHNITELKQETTNSDSEFHPPIGKLVIWTGDLNVAHNAIDIWSLNHNENRAGFTNDERKWFDHLIQDKHYIDIFRMLYPNKQQFSYFEQKIQARKSGKGMRIDYFVVRKDRLNSFNASGSSVVIDCAINTTCDSISDHNPVILSLDKTKLLTSQDQMADDFSNESI